MRYVLKRRRLKVSLSNARNVHVDEKDSGGSYTTGVRDSQKVKDFLWFRFNRPEQWQM